MVAIVTATPNPVVFSWPDVQQGHLRDVDVVWDTGDNRPGQVTITVGDKQAKSATAPTGTVRFQIGFGDTARANLVGTDGRNYGYTEINTRPDPLADYMIGRAFIRKLNVSVGVDSLTVTFTTADDAVGFLLVRSRATASQGAASRKVWASFSIRPQLGVGGGRPRPR